MVNRKRVQAFLQEIYKILREPDFSQYLKLEPVYEAGQWALHVFYPLFSNDDSDEAVDEMSAAINAWNRKFPHVYMTYWAVPVCCDEGSLEGRGFDGYFVHIPLAPAAAMWGVDYEHSELFSKVARAVHNGTYRSDFHRENVMRVLTSREDTPSVSPEQFRHYVVLNNLFSALHLSPNYFRPSRFVVPVYEAHKCGLHVYHPDRGVLALFKVMWDTFNDISWGGSLKGCEGRNCLHVELGPHSAYLINTKVFADVLPRKRR